MAVAESTLLPPDLMAQLERLELVTRKVFRGRMKGERRSKRKGQSVEFADFRSYVPGDDLRSLDWNLYARLDKLIIKLFLEEEDLHFFTLIDASLSMDFGTPTKLQYAKQLAAALGFVGLVNLERVGVAILRENTSEGASPTRGRNQFPKLVDVLARVRPSGRTHLNAALANYALRSREPGVAVLFSDLLDPDGYEAGLRVLLERRYDVHLVHLLDPEEMNPEIMGEFRLLDSETGEPCELTVDGEAIRAYRERLHQFLERVEGFCRTRELGYHRVVTDTPVEEFVLTQLKGLVLT